MNDAAPSIQEPTKRCKNPLCPGYFTPLPLDQFHKNRHRKDGHAARCKACAKHRHKVPYAPPSMKPCSNPLCGKMLPLNAFGPDARRRDGHSARCKTCENQRHADEYKANTDRVLQRHARYYKAHPEYWHQWTSMYHQLHPEKRIAANATRRARKLGAPVNDFTAAQWRAMKAHYGYRCVYCGKKQQRLTQDHITPFSKGGSHTASNIVPACRSCNSKKGIKAPLRPVQPLLILL
jgi:hypothetical protein